MRLEIVLYVLSKYWRIGGADVSNAEATATKQSCAPSASSNQQHRAKQRPAPRRARATCGPLRWSSCSINRLLRAAWQNSLPTVL